MQTSMADTTFVDLGQGKSSIVQEVQEIILRITIEAVCLDIAIELVIKRIQKSMMTRHQTSERSMVLRVPPVIVILI